MRAYFVQIKCELGKAYDVASKIADSEVASEIYSTAGGYDLLVKLYLDETQDLGLFIQKHIQSVPGVRDTYTIVTYKAF